MSTKQESQEFLSDLVNAMTGYKIEEIQENKREEIVAKCVNIFKSFMYDYIENKYDKKDVVRLKSVQIFEDPSIFDKFPDLENKFMDALMFLL
ncbi:hypothetical protein HC766_08120, partial [Candidatus Gracilibacteria bacterium]|nr:hypothetical protein [Candidatus Gracilibacteria bacterium]